MNLGASTVEVSKLNLINLLRFQDIKLMFHGQCFFKGEIGAGEMTQQEKALGAKVDPRG